MAVHTKWYTASKYALALRGEYGTDARRRRGIFLRQQDIFLLGIEGLLRTRVSWRGLIGFAFASLRFLIDWIFHPRDPRAEGTAG
jgi:hypothetical protein